MNPFAELAGLGYGPRLIPILPPTAKISEKSSIFKRVGTSQDPRGKSPGVKGADGLWRGLDWIHYTADENDFERWARHGAGVGIKTGDGLVAIDADTLDEAKATIIRDAVDALSRTAIRVGRFPKALYLFRVSGDYRYTRIEFGDGGRERVEILSDGKQFVANGVHPVTGKPYTWPRGTPSFDSLPIITPDQLDALMAQLRVALGASEIVREGATTDIPQEALRGDLETVRKAVAAIPNTSAHFATREAYRDVGYAIKAALPDAPDDALEIFQDWCARWADGTNDPEVVTADWRRMKPPYRRGASWLYELAERLGDGQFSQAEIWFDQIPDPVESPFDVQARLNADTSNTFRVLDVDEIVNRPPIRWLIARHIPHAAMGFLYSEPGAGKSFMALDMALSMASGSATWFGDQIDAGDEPKVLYIAAEGSYGFRNRIRAWMKHRNRESLPKRFKLIEQTVNFMSAEDIGKLLRTVERFIGHGVVLVVVDTVSRALPGADENLQKDMTMFVAACERIKSALSCSVLGVHHTNKTGEDMRGSSVLRGAGDFMFRLSRKKGATVGVLACDKMKDGPDGWEESYRFDRVALGDGLAETDEGGGGLEVESSLVVDRLDGETMGGAAAVSPATVGAVLSAMQQAWEAGEPWSKAPQSGERRAIRRLVADYGYTAVQADDALRAWEDMGAIRVDVWSSDSKKRGFRVVIDPDTLSQSESVFD